MLSFSITSVNAQILKKIKKRVQETAEETAARKAEEKTAEAIDSLVEKPFKKRKKKRKKKEGGDEENYEEYPESSNEEQLEEEVSEEQPQLWSAYNFIPGDKTIFYDDLSSEENGEFPSRWDLLKGSAQNAILGEESVIQLEDKTIIFPLMEIKEYLPEVFTIEFDAYYPAGDIYSNLNYYCFRLWPEINNHKTSNGDTFKPIYLYNDGISFTRWIGGQARESKVRKSELKNSYGWKHIAIAFNKRSLKIFLDETQVVNIPNLGTKPTQFNLESYLYHDKTGTIKNVRIAEGGKKLYDRVVADGKFVTQGILFDVNSATIKPASGGVLKKVAQMMQAHTDLNFRIEGHTDSDGDDAHNLQLSADRADAVKWALVAMGISEDRFTTEGKGEAIPVADNSTPEGKANNRRVEFIKQ